MGRTLRRKGSLKTTYARIKNLLSGLKFTDEDSLASAVERLSAAVPAAGEPGRFRLSLGDPGDVDGRWRRTIPLEGGAVLNDDEGVPTGGADVEIRCAADTFWRMLDGSYPPVQAYRDGMARVRGDEALAKRLLRHLAGSEGSVDCT